MYHMDLHCKPMTGFNIRLRHLKSAYMRQVEHHREDNSNELRCKNCLIVYHFLGSQYGYLNNSDYNVILRTLLLHVPSVNEYLFSW